MRGGREKCGDSESEERGYDDSAASDRFGKQADDGRGHGDAQRGRADREANLCFRRMKNRLQKRQQRLGVVDLQERADAGEDHRHEDFCRSKCCVQPELEKRPFARHITGGTLMPITASRRINSRRAIAAVVSRNCFRCGSGSLRM